MAHGALAVGLAPVRLPNHKDAIVDERKLRDYLLSQSHPVGRFKARFKIAAQEEAMLLEENMFGRRYLVLGTVTGPSGRTAGVATRRAW